GGPWTAAQPGNFSVQQTGLLNGDEVTFEVRAISPFPDCEPLIGSTTCVKTCQESPFNNQITPPTCAGEANGSVQILTNTSIPPYTFTLNGISNADGLFTGLPAGAYPASILNGEGCLTLSTVVVPQPDPLQVEINAAQDASCFGFADGSASATSTGGTGASLFAWSNGQSGPVADGLSAGVYEVIATDLNGCTAVASVTIGANPPLQAAMASVSAACYGQASGSLSVAPSGGTGSGYGYQWNDPNAQNTPTASNLPAGTYQVIVNDANGCTLTLSGTVAQPDSLLLSLSGLNPSCNGSANGAINASAQGGVGGYTFAWDNNQIGPSVSQLSAGTYIAVVSDANGCTASASYTLAEPDPIGISAAGLDIACHGQSSGGINLTASGGNGGYSVQWSGPDGYTATGAQIQGLAAGVYNATVSDALGCTAIYTLTLAQPAAPLSLSLPSPAFVVCHAASDGVATVSASGGTAPYTYAWSAGNQTAPTAVNLPPGSYSVLVRDAQGCTAQAATLIEEKGPISAEITLVPPKCHNGDDGRAIVSAAFYGANPAPLSGFGFEWSTIPAQNSATATGLRAESQYAVTLTDAQGCTGVQTITTGNTPPMTAAISNLNHVRCHGDASGSAQAIGSGGLEPYSYLWSPGPAIQTAQTAENLKAGVYRVTITDANGCAVITSVEVNEPPALTRQLNRTAVACYGESTGSASVNPSGGSPPYQYVWNNGAITAAISQLPVGEYAVTVTDANGCTTVGEIAVEQPEAPLTAIATAKDAGCFGAYTGSITFEPSGGAGPYQYALNDGPYNGSRIQIGLSAGTYTPRLIDRNGCTLVLAPVTLTQNPAPVLDLGPDLTLRFGDSIQLFSDLSYAAEPVVYTWDPSGLPWLSCGDCPDPWVRGLRFSTYFTLSVTDALGCSATDRIRISIEKPRRIFVPTGFSPNGDGANDVLPVHGQADAKVLSFRIFDRWGELAYEGQDLRINDETQGWDGSFRGQAMPPGVYVWMLDVEYPDGERETLRGETTLIR
ncbi:MAG: gliding motility-associated C-terminal domain-containing protein, partial [Saprospiraceae bacterium]